ncbi:unnamed protein product [Acanthoscelides obtectus]|uniref:C2H2-type domain-containing protein n=1 Tax=Acanthoscelides obtectus TaxID=200917 RepID=A0A9P0LEC7_ACAOB|nr:unnamed protein product [Acanthoscelides obtectus]CAK1658881.1 hypothetical protein AOBTE_LOCUS21184 [Acanthoscelides obtectus]
MSKKCLRFNMLPIVSLAMDEVETYFEKRNIDFHKYAQKVLRSFKKDISAKTVQGGSGSLTNAENNPSKSVVVNPIKIATNDTGYTIISKPHSEMTENGTNVCVDKVNQVKEKLAETEAESSCTNKTMKTTDATPASRISEPDKDVQLEHKLGHIPDDETNICLDQRSQIKPKQSESQFEASSAPQTKETRGDLPALISLNALSEHKHKHTIADKTNICGDHANQVKRKLPEDEDETSKAKEIKLDTPALQINESEQLHHVCDVCKAVRHSLDALNKHKLWHTTQDKTNICEHPSNKKKLSESEIEATAVNKTVKTKDDTDASQINAPGQSRHICDICKTVRHSLSALHKHKRTHTSKDKSNICEDQTNQIKQKLSESEIEATAVNRTVKTKDDTDASQINAPEQWRHICDICKTVRHSLSALNKHKLTHTAEDKINICEDQTNQVKQKLSESEIEATAVNKIVKTKDDTDASQINAPEQSRHICDICNSVRNSQSALKKHKLKHSKCPFCKTRLKSVEEKRKHLKGSCDVRNLKRSCRVPCEVKLEKMELNRSIREKYPQAFTEFPPFPGMEEKNLNRIARDYEESVVNDHKRKRTCDRIVSNGEDSSGAVNDTEKESANDEKTPKVTVDTCKPANLNQCNVNPIADSNLTIETSSFSKNSNSNPEPTEEVYTSVSVVRPIINIKNCSILDYLDPKASDVKLIRDLLLTKTNNQIGSLDQSTQTEYLVNGTVTANQNEITAEFKGLKNMLHFYKIPVVIKHGSFSVSYNTDNTKNEKKNMCLWDNLEPIDVAEVKPIPVPKEASSILQGSSNKALLINPPTESSVAAPVTANPLTNCKNPGNVTNRDARPFVTIETPSTSKEPNRETFTSISMMPTFSATTWNQNSYSNPVSGRHTSSEILQTTASMSGTPTCSSNTIGSLSRGTHVNAIPRHAPHPVLPSTGTFQNFNMQGQVSTLYNNIQLAPASQSSVRMPVLMPQQNIQSIMNQTVNRPYLQGSSANEGISQLQGTSGNPNAGESSIPAPGSIRVKSLYDLT